MCSEKGITNIVLSTNHTACDGHGFVLGTVVPAGNVHDSAASHPLHNRLATNFPQIHAAFADPAYKTPNISKRIFETGRVLSTACKHPQTLRDRHEWYVEISESTLYPILRRLETAELLTVRSVEHNGRLRKYDSITPQGQTRIESFQEEWNEIVSIYRFITREDGANEYG